MTVEIINDYYASIDHLSKILTTLDLSLKNLNIKFKQILETNKSLIMEALNSLYSIEENPSKEINENFDLFELLGTKFSAISDKVYTSNSKLTLLKANVKKHSEVTLSLLKMAHTKNKAHEEGRFPQLDQLQ